MVRPRGVPRHDRPERGDRGAGLDRPDRPDERRESGTGELVSTTRARARDRRADLRERGVAGHAVHRRRADPDRGVTLAATPGLDRRASGWSSPACSARSSASSPSSMRPVAGRAGSLRCAARLGVLLYRASASSSCGAGRGMASAAWPWPSPSRWPSVCCSPSWRVTGRRPKGSGRSWIGRSSSPSTSRRSLGGAARRGAPAEREPAVGLVPRWSPNEPVRRP